MKYEGLSAGELVRLQNIEILEHETMAQFLKYGAAA